MIAVDDVFVKTGIPRLPVTVSATIIDSSGRNLSGQTVNVFFVCVKHARPFAVGVNCAQVLCRWM